MPASAHTFDVRLPATLSPSMGSALLLAAALLLASVLAVPAAATAQEADAASASASASATSHVQGLSAEEAIATITAETIYNRLYFIASDALMGRNTPSPGLEAAAKYIVSEYMRMGIGPAGVDGTYYQRWPYRQVRTDTEAVSLTLTGNGTELSVDPETMAVRGASDDDLDLQLIFAGSADAVAGSDLSGHAAVFLRSGELTNPWIGGLNNRVAAAQAAGARATIFVVDDAFVENGMEQLLNIFGNPQWRMGWGYVLPQVLIPRSEFLAAFPEAGPLFDTDDEGILQPLDGRLSGSIPAELLVDGRPPNVVGKIEGSDPELRDEYMVLSAHFDHTGVTSNPVDGDSINNGADDNGSGTVALMEVARAISEMDEAPRRSILFVHVSGEEKGLLGAEWFVDHPTVPLDAMVANINADMIGSDAHTDTLVVIGKNYSSLGPLVDEINAGMPELNLTTSDDIWPNQRFFFRSDQFHFLRKEIPALFFFTGTHECYHAVCDEVDRLDHDKAARITRLLAHSVLEIANADERPRWDSAGLEEVRELTGGGR